MATPIFGRDGRRLPDRDVIALEHLGGILRRGRRQLGWTQRQLGHAIGVHQTTISRLENGRLTNFSLVKLGRLAMVLKETMRLDGL